MYTMEIEGTAYIHHQPSVDVEAIPELSSYMWYNRAYVSMVLVGPGPW